MRPFDGIDRLERWSSLDGAVRAVKTLVDRAIPAPAARDALHGRWLGHALHPSLIVVPLGSWISASVLDVLPGNERAARTLTGLGVLSALPTAAAGAVDWSDLHPEQQRVGLVHAAANSVALVLQAASWRARRRGADRTGAALSLLGLGSAGFGGLLGGHLSYRQAAGVNHTEEVPHLLPAEYTALCRLDELPDGELTQRTLVGVALAVLRTGNTVRVLADRCSHLSGPLSDGELSGTLPDGSPACVTCPWHGSTFQLTDGAVVRGPSTYPQPVLQARVDPSGTVEVRLPGAS